MLTDTQLDRGKNITSLAQVTISDVYKLQQDKGKSFLGYTDYVCS